VLFVVKEEYLSSFFTFYIMITYKLQTDGKAKSTGVLMRQVVEKYYQDMAPYASLSLLEIFYRIKNLPYRPDPAKVETLMRPRYTMLMQGSGGDCDDKSIALAAYARLYSIPYRFVAIRRPGRKNLHHVATELYINGKWLFADPTYSFNTLGRTREEAERVYI
jgi:transglutaminase-like putative cysteine protease